MIILRKRHEVGININNDDAKNSFIKARVRAIASRGDRVVVN
jgi:hypothetical protein